MIRGTAQLRRDLSDIAKGEATQQETQEAQHVQHHGPPDWNVPGPGDLAMSGPLNTSVRVAPQIPQSTTIEALRHMRDTTQSQQQYQRAVEALRQMGVDHD